MAQFDTAKVRFGTVDRWIPTTREGRHWSGGYGWVRGKGANAGRAFIHATGFARVGYNESEYRLGYSTTAEFPSTLTSGTEVVLVLVTPTPEKGPAAEWWATRKNWDDALQKRRAHLLTRHTDNGDGAVTEVQFYVDLNGNEAEVGREVLPVREEMKYHDSANWSARAEGMLPHLWLVERQSPVYEFCRTQVRKVADLATGPVTKFEMTRIPGENGWVYAPHERRFRPSAVWVQPRDHYNHDNAMKPIIGYGQFVVKVRGVNPDGKEVEVSLANPTRADAADHYIRKDEWGWLEVPRDLRLDFYRRYPACKCRKARYEAAKYAACYDCRVRAEYGTCVCGRTASQYNKLGERYFCSSAECGAFARAKASALLEQTLSAGTTGEEFRMEAITAKIAAEAKRLIGGRVMARGAEEVREWLEAKASELIPDDGYSADYKRRDLVARTRFDYHNSIPLAVVEAEDGYWASHVSPGLLHRCAKLEEADAGEIIAALSLLAGTYHEEGRSRRQREPKLNARRADGTLCRVWGKDARATRPVKRERSVPPVRLESAHIQWLVRSLERNEPVIARRFAETEDAIAATREFVESAAQALAQLKEQDNRRTEDSWYLPERKLEEARQNLRWGDYGKARAVAQALLDECAEHQAELDARRAREASGEVWLNVRVPLSTRSQTHAKAWAIRPDGNILEPTKEYSGVGRHRELVAYQYGDLATSVLVVGHICDTYGYRHTERWLVHHLPKVVTPEQVRTLRLLADESRTFFAGTQADWDLRHVGAVSVTTSYGRADHIVGEEEMYHKMISSEPIVMEEWTVEVAERQEYDMGITYVVWHRPRQRTPQPSLDQTERATAETLGLARIQREGAAAQTSAPEGRTEDIGDRWFRCLADPCRTTERVSKSDWKKYQAGEALTIRCPGCGRVAVVKK